MKDYFASNDEKITEKAFSQSLVISVVSILLCLVALCSMTYAWFNSETTSSGNTLASSSFAMDKPVIDEIKNGTIATVGEIAVNDDQSEKGIYSCTLPAGTYRVTLTSGASTGKGHCVIMIGGLEKTTDAIVGAQTVNKVGYEKNSPFVFQIETSTEIEIVFQAVWGVIAEPDIGLKATYSADTQKVVSDESTDEPTDESTEP